MEEASDPCLRYSCNIFKIVNIYRLYLQVSTLADIADLEGGSIKKVVGMFPQGKQVVFVGLILRPHQHLHGRFGGAWLKRIHGKFGEWLPHPRNMLHKNLWDIQNKTLYITNKEKPMTYIRERTKEKMSSNAWGWASLHSIQSQYV